eukprot:TRINITY_DN4873_c0_g1_i1.p1 TRINITY_DN4873_c0_g1~~TRINITY_DN4873_c0_g1_i1.p1  ORF type:complete len:379 (+),score=229.82 TRINITY_DN4873_c0_g1_i1:41-1138(+)
MSDNKRKVSFGDLAEKPAKIQKNEDGSSDEEGNGQPFEWKNFAQGAQEAVETYDSFSHTIKRRISALDKIQTQIDGVTAEYEKEYNALIAKYQGLRQPHLEKRKSIISGALEPSDAEIADADLKAPVSADEKKGIPEFWSRVFTITNFHALLGEKDLEALKKVVDVRAITKKQDEFDFEFHFVDNEFFSNPIIRRTFHITHTSDGSDTIERSEGTVINWKSAEDDREDWSFFKMFEGEWIPDDPNGNEHQEFMDIILQLKEMILNNPTKYFKMDTQMEIPDVEDDDEDELEDDYGFEDFDEDEDDEDDDEDEEEEEEEKKVVAKRKIGGKTTGKFSKGQDKAKVKVQGKSLKADESEKPPECKTQ